MFLNLLKGALIAFIYCTRLYNGKVHQSFKTIVPVHVRFGDEGFTFPDLIQAAQLQIDFELEQLGVSNWTVNLIDELEASRSIDRNLNSLDDLLNFKPVLSHDLYELFLLRSEENSIGIDSEFFRSYLFYTLESVHSNDLPFYVAQAIVYQFFQSEISMFLNGCRDIKQLTKLKIHFNKIQTSNGISDENPGYLEEAINDMFVPFQSAFQALIPLEITDQNPDLVFSYTSEPSLSTNEIPFLFTSSEYYGFMKNVIYKIERYIGIPENPNNNLLLKIQMIKRCLTARKGYNLTTNNSVNLRYWDDAYENAKSASLNSPTVSSINWIPINIKVWCFLIAILLV